MTSVSAICFYRKHAILPMLFSTGGCLALSTGWSQVLGTGWSEEMDKLSAFTSQNKILSYRLKVNIKRYI